MKNTSKIIKNENVETTIFSDRGGIITSIKIDGTELLYQDMYNETLLNESKSVRGGIPYMFPNAGPLTENEEKKSGFKLPQHGFGRISKWKENKNCENGNYSQNYKLDYSDSFPFSLYVENIIELEKKSFKSIHKIKNNGENTAPISTGFHPYFRIPEGKKEEIKWTFNGGENIKKQIDIWSNDGTITLENPGIPLELFIPGIGNITIDVSQDYKNFWIRSIPGKDFICIEPVMGDEGDIINNPVLVHPGEINRNFMRITLNK